MHHVKRGDFWAAEERSRLGRIGESPTFGGSPYPSAWRGDIQDGLRRGGSLRVPPKPRLNRMSSAEPIKASDDAVDGASSPAAVRLWAKWSQNRGDHAAVSLLLDSGDGVSHCPSASIRSPVELASDQPITPPLTFAPYDDGEPAMSYLDGAERVEEGVRLFLRRMTLPAAADRPTAVALQQAWEQIGLKHT
jgi:hypothetical protein